ncbi:Protein SPIRAL1-like [Actinidia chinensis var. chinensis]|uniref:Protein SPIRAL1-like n=1 Tax=Actinidia chinensis var. chinensis TaxID=1590841 RepID=A0A2R6Q8K9_ACTCC|nr:protein SPIRAL1-like 5 [Actinidia eriantha]PSS04198.1 Protein SPIRAL1-like [Actinidia chinensis var. chinensis]
MSRGGSFGGGQSSLGYLFGSDEQKTAPPASPIVCTPPYGIDTTPEKPPKSPHPQENRNVSNNYHRSEGQNSGNFITDRPSTKVKSVPGGDSSLGYLFGDK